VPYVPRVKFGNARYIVVPYIGQMLSHFAAKQRKTLGGWKKAYPRRAEHVPKAHSYGGEPLQKRVAAIVAMT
jgi:hypothetical protein